MKRIIVSDTGPITSLEKLIEGFDFIRRLYDEILVPPSVLEELCQNQFQSGEAYLEAFGTYAVKVGMIPAVTDR